MADAGSPLAARSARVVVKQRHRTCRRCAQRINKDLEGTCDVQDNVRCGYCARLRHECLSVPEKFNSDLNRLYRLARDYNMTANGSPEEAQARRLLDARQKKFNKELHAFTRAAGRHGAHAKPKSAAEIALLQLQQTTRVADALEHLVDLKRVEMNLPNIDPKSPTPSESSSSSSSDDDSDGDSDAQDAREENEDEDEEMEEAEDDGDADPFPDFED